MSKLSIFSKRKYRICYWNSEKRIVDSEKMVLEQKLQRLGQIEFVELNTLEDKNFHPCDLLIVAANNVPAEGFGKWLSSLTKRIRQQEKIWTPALVLSPSSFDTLDEILIEAVQSNWYFDVLDIRHVDSLPIRVANLLRIHDHLHELRRYSDQLETLSGKVENLQKTVTKLTGKAHESN